MKLIKSSLSWKRCRCGAIRCGISLGCHKESKTEEKTKKEPEKLRHGHQLLFYPMLNKDPRFDNDGPYHEILLQPGEGLFVGDLGNFSSDDEWLNHRRIISCHCFGNLDQIKLAIDGDHIAAGKLFE